MEANFDVQNYAERPEIVSPAFVLLLGPSGVGKTEIIKRLTVIDPRIVVSPAYTDRKPRENDFGRVSVSEEEFSKMLDNGEFLTIEPSYGNRYAVNKEFVLNALKERKIPIQDYPESKVQNLKDKVAAHAIYIVPPSLTELRNRLQIDGRHTNPQRYIDSKEELLRLVGKHFKTENIDEVVINRDLDSAVAQVLNSIYTIVSK